MKKGIKAHWIFVPVNSYGYPVKIPVTIKKVLKCQEKAVIEFRKRKKDGQPGVIMEKTVKISCLVAPAKKKQV